MTISAGSVAHEDLSKRTSNWRIVLGAVLGLIVGNGPMMQFTFGVFLTALVESFQSDRGTLSAALMMGLCATGIATPVAGWLVDRYGVRRITLPAVLLSGSGMVALGWLPNSSTKFVALYGVVGLVWGGQTPLPYARAVAGAFDRRRGLALGIAMTGVGLGAALIPLLAAHLLASFG